MLATTARGFELKGLGELWDLLREVGDDKAEVKISDISGVVIAKTSFDPIFFVEKVKEIVSREPWKVKNLLRLIPLERNVEANLDLMKEKLKEIKDKIAINESFRITVEKRYTNLSSKEIIEALAKIVDMRVSLEEPDWIVLVEIVKNRAGISVLKEEQIVSFVKLKRA
ncbi:hypothetical protein HRbin06_00317 [archaeon HR06]|nr:hypothetical protein HRbin06_00317 [archaeon HR06]